MKKLFCALILSAALVLLSPPAEQLNNSLPRTKVQAVQAEAPRKESTTSNIPNQELRSQEKALTEQTAVVEPETVAPVAIPEPQPVTPKEIAQAKAAQHGWVGSEWDALVELWHKESGWNPGAVNKSSGACGIPQAYPCSKIPNPGSVESQIEWGVGYVASRYGSPSKALAFWKYEAPLHNGSNWY